MHDANSLATLETLAGNCASKHSACRCAMSYLQAFHAQVCAAFQVRATWIKNTKKMSFDEAGKFSLLDIQVGGAPC